MRIDTAIYTKGKATHYYSVYFTKEVGYIIDRGKRKIRQVEIDSDHLFSGEYNDRFPRIYYRLLIDTLTYIHEVFGDTNLIVYIDNELVVKIYNQLLDRWIKNGTVPNKYCVDLLPRIIELRSMLSKVVVKKYSQSSKVYSGHFLSLESAKRLSNKDTV